MSAVGPTTRIAGVSAFFAISPSVPSVASMRVSFAEKPLERIAAGVPGSFPQRMRFAAIVSADLRPIRKMSVPSSFASAS